MDSSSRGRPRHRPCRGSQVPRSLSQCVPSLTTPESRTTARACGFIVRTGFAFSERLATLNWRFEAKIGFAIATAHTVRLPRLRRRDCSPSTLGQLHVSQAVHMATSLQVTRETRLSLAHRSRGRFHLFSQTRAPALERRVRSKRPLPVPTLQEMGCACCQVNRSAG